MMRTIYAQQKTFSGADRKPPRFLLCINLDDFDSEHPEPPLMILDLALVIVKKLYFIVRRYIIRLAGRAIKSMVHKLTII